MCIHPKDVTLEEKKTDLAFPYEKNTELYAQKSIIRNYQSVFVTQWRDQDFP